MEKKKVRITSGIFWTLMGKNLIMEKSDAGAACLSWTFFFFHNSVGYHIYIYIYTHTKNWEVWPAYCFILGTFHSWGTPKTRWFIIPKMTRFCGSHDLRFHTIPHPMFWRHTIDSQRRIHASWTCVISCPSNCSKILSWTPFHSQHQAGFFPSYLQQAAPKQ